MIRWLFWVCFEWAILAAALTVVWHYPLTIPLMIIAIGSRTHALAVLGHEVTHHTLGRSKWLDRLANYACFWPINIDGDAYRSFHVAHHAFLGTKRDPELRARNRRADAWVGLTARKRARLIGGDLIGLGIPEVIGVFQNIGGLYTAERVAALIALSMGAVMLGIWPLLILWQWSVVTATWACMRYQMFGEHNELGPGETHRYVAQWWERLIFVPHGIWKHYDHHRSRRWSVPWYRLRP